ncbi:NitT/TauT family transport system permease protein [Kitasatospora sp. MAA4]|uniref:ABC transporter permease n=1 Tax=Kitasatospora sp. MAA4 TaxID=3035093 RepID=UPI002475AD20|nr:ABC transporter permease [Kitasatospora sp. MAA4]MDH6133316.1 NitT/TauT family transport system permease protein [Kitasatospora sp. MAA4]
MSSAVGTKAPSAELAAATGAGVRAVRRRRLLVLAARLAVAVVVVGGWQLVTTWGWLDPFFFGQPSGIARRLVDYFSQGDQATEFGSYWVQIETTLREAVFGFVAGAVTGIVFGVALGQNRFLADVFGPYIKVVNAIPRIVLGSIFVVAFGIGETPKVLLAAVLVFFVVFFNAFQGVREVDRNILANARVLGASPLQIVRHVVVPSALTWIIASLHTAFGFAIVGALVGEVLGAQSGLGLVIKTAQNSFDPNGVFATMFVIAIIALTAEWLLTKLERRLLSWRPPAPSEAAAI